MLNKEELISILALENSTNIDNSKNEAIAFIKERLDALGVQYDEQKECGCHNIFSIKEGRPLICCHTDSMKKTFSDISFKKKIGWPPIEISEEDGKIIARRAGVQAVIGGDDGCGIFILLNLIENGADISFAFFSNEETGMVGSRVFDHSLLKGIPWGILVDRRGNNEIICHQNYYGSLEFENALCDVGEEFGYSASRGLVSDADVLRNYISCANLSCGYHHAHTPEEYVVYDDVINAYNYVARIIETLGDRQFEVNERFASVYIEDAVKKTTKKLKKKFVSEFIEMANETSIENIMIEAISERDENEEAEREE